MDDRTVVQGNSIKRAWKDSPRPHQALILIVIAYILWAAACHLFMWARHTPLLWPWLIALVTISMLAFTIWHSVMVKGVRQTVAFFFLAWAISWFLEFIGHNYAWFFGHYKYTDTLGPRLGGVPLLITATWAVAIYAAFMLIDWLLELGGAKRGRSCWGKALWTILVSAATATLVCALDLLIDPFATSRVWIEAAHKKPWWYWAGGPYLKELRVWRGKGGIPIGNFVGWWLAPFAIILIFYVFFQRKNRVDGKLVNAVPIVLYFLPYFSLVFLLLEMNWFENGINQVALIGTFAVMPVVMVSLVKLIKDYTNSTMGSDPNT